MQLPICSKLQCNDICDKFVCDGSRPHYIGDNGIDIASHVCWLISCLFWHRVLFSFIAVQLFELKRRAKLTEVRLQAADSRVCCCHLFYQEWADTLRHGRDRSVSFILFFESTVRLLFAVVFSSFSHLILLQHAAHRHASRVQGCGADVVPLPGGAFDPLHC